MKRKWTVDQLETAVEQGHDFGDELLVADGVEVLSDYGDVATVYFHLEGTDGESDGGEYEFTFNNTRSLDENFDELWQMVERERVTSYRTGATASMR